MSKIGKRLTAALLTLVLAVGLVPRSLAAGGFGDITDQTTAINAEVLMMMGVVDGTGGGNFNPGGQLTRAQFSKMAVEVMGQGDRVFVHKNYTIFPDVKPSHWAAGYVNLASSIEIPTAGEEGASIRLITGVGDGTFRPDAPITYGQAVTILMRMLGYSDSDVGAVWPDGYIDLAMAEGVVKNPAGGMSIVTRSQAAQLFVNVLRADKKGGGKFYETLGKGVEVILLDANAKDAAGVPMMKTSEGDYYIAGNPGSGLLSGYKGTLIVNDKNEVVTFLPSGSGVSREITIAKAEAGSITDSNGKVYVVDADATMYQGGESKKYTEGYMFLRSGTMATIFVNDRNRVDTLFVGSTTSDDAIVIEKDGSTEGFSLLTDRTDYRIVKHGEEIPAKNLRAYDVATYSASNNTIYISDNRITVYYADAYPSPAAPTYIKASGINGGVQAENAKGYLEVMPCALPSLSTKKVGSTITLLLTENNKVAGVSDSTAIRGNSVGFVDDSGKVTLFNGLTVDGTVEEKYHGQLVMVNSVKDGIRASKFSGNSTRGDFDPVKKTVGDTPLAADVRIYRTIAGNQIEEITLNEITEVVKKDNVLYARKNYVDKVDILVISSSAGDTLHYGRAYVEQTVDDNGEVLKTTTTIQNAKSDKLGVFEVDRGLSTGQWIGFSVSPTNSNLMTRMVMLKAVKNVPVSAFRDEKTVYYGGTLYTVGSGIDNTCYNKATGTWFENLNRALSYGGSLTLMVDDDNVIRAIEIG